MKRSRCLLIFSFLLSLSARAARIPAGDLLEGVQPGPDGKIDILTVFAHQDDEHYSGGTLLKMKRDERVRLHLLCLTLGDLSEARDRLNISGDHLGRIRSEELETAAAVYKAEQVIQFRYHDQGLESTDHEKLVREILEVIERIDAEVVLTHEPLGFTRHPDHIAASRAATEAFRRSEAQMLYYPTLPWTRYYFQNLFVSVKDRERRAVPSVRVDISKQRKLKKMAFYAHASQKHFSGVGLNHEVIHGGNHEYFELAASNE